MILGHLICSAWRYGHVNMRNSVSPCRLMFSDLDLFGRRWFEAILFLVNASFTHSKKFQLWHLNSVHFCGLLDLFGNRWFDAILYWYALQEYVISCKRAVQFHVRRVIYISSFASVISVIRGNIILGMRWMRLYIKASSFFASVFVKFWLSHL